MNALLRRNACPSLAAPMRTGDGLLVRLNTLTGAISPTAFAAIALAAARHGNGMLEVTRRGSLQIRGLTESSSIALAREIDALGLELRRGVPVEIGPLAGLDPQELADPRPLAARIRALIGDTGLAAQLGPKVSVVIDGGGQLSMREVLADVRLSAVISDGTVRWQVAVGGTADAARLVGIADMDNAAAVAIGLLRAIAARGKSGRGRDLTEAESEMAWHAPAGEAGATECQHAAPHMHAELAAKAANSQTRAATSAVGRFRLKNHGTAIGVGLPFGQADWDQLSSLAQVAESLGVSEFRLAPGRALLAVCGGEAEAEAFGRAAGDLGFVVAADDPRLRIIACAGAPACAGAHLPARQIAAELAAAPELAERSVGTIHVSGCDKRCAEPERASLTLVGSPDGAFIRSGRDGPVLASVAREEAVVALRRVLDAADMGGGTSPPARANRKGR